MRRSETGRVDVAQRPTIDSTAARQRGLVTGTQFDKLKVPSSTRSDWAKAGRIHLVHDNVYRLNGSPVTFEQKCLAATLAAAPTCFVDARGATQLWGFCEFDEGFVDVIVPRCRNPRLDGVRVYRSDDLAKFKMTRRLGIPIVPPTLALLDLGVVCDEDTVKEAMEQAFVTRRTSPAELRAALELVRRPGRAGVGVIRKLLDARALGDDIPDAKSEVTFAELCRRFGLPLPMFHFNVFDANGVFLAEPDFAYPERRIAIEVDSVSIHGTAQALQRDFERQNKLINAGWIVLRFSWHDLKFRPEYVADTIRQALGT
jgi:very-short-patch-repair endonuclease